MRNVLIVGGGLAGCTTALQLSEAGIRSVLLESTDRLGGKARDYGCKADMKCNQCGVCLTGGLWDKVSQDTRIETHFHSGLNDLYPSEEGFVAYVRTSSGMKQYSVTDVVLASGFSDYAEHSKAAAEVPASSRILTGHALEHLLKFRTATSLFPEPPASVAFVLCFGSRDVKEKAQYCSRVCCAYSTRSAKVIRHLYPDAEVTMFYMDLQTVNTSSRYLEELNNAGIHFERCRPARISLEGDRPSVLYEGTDGFRSKTYDYVVLCGGIHADEQNTALSDITGLRVDEHGFLQYVLPPEKTHVYLAGCVSGPKNLRETAADARNIALRIANFSREDDLRP